MRPPLYDVTDPRRSLTVPQCTSGGLWCSGRWVGLAELCQRPHTVPVCPELTPTALTAFELVRRLAAADEEDTVIVKCAGEGWTVRGLWEHWQQPAPPEPDVLDLAGETGACTACGWRCEVCASAPRAAAVLPACRALNGSCALAEAHVAECAAALVRWVAPHRGATVVPVRTAVERPPEPAARAVSRRARRRAVRTWVRSLNLRS